MSAKILRELAEAANADAVAAFSRGDTEGAFYASGLRDAYANAANFWVGGDPAAAHEQHAALTATGCAQCDRLRASADQFIAASADTGRRGWHEYPGMTGHKHADCPGPAQP